MTDDTRSCFGILNEVFPVGPEGLREVPGACFQCPHKTACLKAALKTEDGVEFRTQVLDRTPATGIMGRLKRWSERKSLSRQKQAGGGKQK